MKHLLDITNFLVEALTPEFKEKYRKHFEKRTKKVQERLNKLLDNQERVYIPYNSDTISETQLKVKDYLEDQGYKILDYKLNSAVQIENSKRQIRISKLLAKNPELLKEFTLDDTRANTRAGSEFMIALTSNYEDVAGMSYRRCWDNSCLDIDYGENKRYVKDEVKQGTVVAYLIKSDDLEIEKPLGRVNIKPYYSNRDEKEILYFVDRRVYGNVPDEKLFKKIITSYLKEKQEVKLFGFYNKVEGLYSDWGDGGSPEYVSLKKGYVVCYDCRYDEEGFNRHGYNKEGFDREGFNTHGYNKDGYNKDGYNKDGISKNGDYPYKEHLTKEQYLWLKQKTKSDFNVDENGLVNVDGDVNISNQRLNEIPVKFGVVKGDFYCHRNNLTSLEGVPREVKGDFYCDDNYNLTSLVGAPREVKGDFSCSYNNLISLVGAPKEVGYFTCSHNPNLTSLVGAPSVCSFFNCSYNNLTSLVGAPKETGHFDCSYNNLTSLVGAPSIVDFFNCYLQKNGHRFTYDDVLKVSQVKGGWTGGAIKV